MLGLKRTRLQSNVSFWDFTKQTCGYVLPLSSLWLQQVLWTLEQHHVCVKGNRCMPSDWECWTKTTCTCRLHRQARWVLLVHWLFPLRLPALALMMFTVRAQHGCDSGSASHNEVSELQRRSNPESLYKSSNAETAAAELRGSAPPRISTILHKSCLLGSFAPGFHFHSGFS